MQLFNRISTLFLALGLLAAPMTVNASGKHEMDAAVKSTLNTFYSQVTNGKELADQAAGILVFPKVNKAGMVVGSEYGEGALIERGMTTGYYSTFSASVGIQLGAQVRSQVFMFMNEQALSDFKHNEEWQLGADGAVAAPDIGPHGHVSPEATSEPVLSFMFNNKGVMFGAGLEGTMVKKIDYIDLSGVHFALNSAELTPTSRAILDDAVATLKMRGDASVGVAAHTCNIGSAEYNKALSDRRAASVKAYLQSKGIGADRLVAMGYGASQPVASNMSRQGRMQNRRVELRVTESDEYKVAAFNK